ncbi:glycerophosphodiester phosphodiesterase [Microbulbifer yueqingensis]|uniref:Glycerophosphoryl diester phosphodiesterase n=1 Tax=Microbulbifer yueqingensis TaxID=658219 RepID=A0A1G8XNB0_9GAMM|nr:glycerophosphodiester phosphodiesterase [Microbulbifer yueqingensis]SDJ91916.1 glycerophosphoryl diester phosphodiesterase [Microbulbifer yueqingensis]
MMWFALFCLLLAILWFYARGRLAQERTVNLPAGPTPMVIAHGDERGRGLYPGNTLLYVREMASLGVDAVEVDLNLTADGHLVLIHDDVLERTTDGEGRVIDLSLEELRGLRLAENWTRDGISFPYRDSPLSIATIDEVFDAVADIPLIIELKNNDLAAAHAMCAAIRRAGQQHRVIVSTFHKRVIDEFRRICPEVTTGASLGDALLFYVAQLLRAETLLRPAYQTMQLPLRYFGLPVIGSRFLKAAHSLDLHISVWTVNAPEQMRWLTELGVDGIVTDRPDILQNLNRRNNNNREVSNA